MSFFSRLFGNPQANSITTSEDLAKVLQQVGAMLSASSGVSVTPSKAEGLPAAFRAVELIGDTLATIRCELFRDRINDKGRLVSEAAVDDPRYWLLYERANERQTAFQFKKMLQTDQEWRGVGYALKVFGVGRRIQELIRLHPDRTRPVENSNNELEFEYTRPDGRRIRYRQNEIVHLLKNTDDGLNAKSVLKLHRETFGEGLAMQRHSGKFFANGTRTTGVLKLAQGLKMGDDSVKALRKDFNDLYQGVDNAFETPFLPAGIDYSPVTINHTDAQYIEARQMSIRDISRIFGPPPHKLGDLADATFSNVEEQNIEFVNDCAKPRGRLWTEVLTRDVLEGEQKLEFRFGFSALLRGKAKEQAETHNLYRRMGVWNANEIRSDLGANPREDEGGEQFIVEKNMSGTRAPESEIEMEGTQR